MALQSVIAVDNGKVLSGGGGGGSTPSMGARLMITSTVQPTVTTPSGGSITPVAVSGETNRWYADSFEYGLHSVTQTTGGTQATISVNVRACQIYEVADKTTFEGVQQILNAHMETDFLTVGDEMAEITLTGNEPMVWVVGAINHEQQHQVIFVPKWCLSTTRQMNNTNTNVGGWNSAALRIWLNGDFYNNLPDSVKPYIKDRTFQTSQGNKSSTLQSATDKIWLPRAWEIFGATARSATTEHTEGGAEQLPIFATTASRIKTAGKAGAACDWWESSPHISDATTFCGVTASGDDNDYYAINSYNVLPCFHMLADS